MPDSNSSNFEENQPFLSEPEVEAIRLLEHRWLSEELAGNLNGILELCSDDVVWLPPGLPALAGKDASIAYKLAEFRTRYVPAGSSSSAVIKGTHLWILRRKHALVWEVALVTWTIVEEHSSNMSPGKETRK